MKNINKDIENNTIKQFYLLYGDEDYLKNQCRDNLIDALVSREDNMNLGYFGGKHVKLQEVMDLGETLPFFSEHRVLVIENTGWFSKSPEDIEKRFATLPETTHIVFIEKDVDKRTRLYKFVDKSGYVSLLDAPDERQLVTWIKSLCKNAGKVMDDKAIYYFLEHVGTDMLLIKNETDKLIGYIGEREEILIEDISRLCVSQAKEKMFEMLDAIGTHNQDKALRLYRDMLALREQPLSILRMLTRHYRILMNIKGLARDGMSDSDMLAFLKSTWKLQPFAVKKYKAQAAGYEYVRLKDMVEQCHMTDQNVKNGNVQDVVGVELLIVEFSSGL